MIKLTESQLDSVVGGWPWDSSTDPDVIAWYYELAQSQGFDAALNEWAREQENINVK